MRLSKTDVIFLSIRLTVTFSLFHYLGVLYGLFAIWLYFSLNYVMMRYCFGLDAVSPVDTLLVHDDEGNVSNIVSK